MSRKRLFYVPGLISLIALPILLLIYGPEDYVRKNAVKLFLPSNETTDDGHPRYSIFYVSSMLKDKTIIEFDFANDATYYGKSNLSSIKRSLIKYEIEHLDDTAFVLKIQFGNDNTYADFMWVLNQVIICNIKQYAVIGNFFYIFPNAPLPPSEDLENSRVYLDIPIEYDAVEVNQPSVWERFNWWLEDKIYISSILIKHNRPLIIGFLVLILIPSLVRLRNLTQRPQGTQR